MAKPNIQIISIKSCWLYDLVQFQAFADACLLYDGQTVARLQNGKVTVMRLAKTHGVKPFETANWQTLFDRHCPWWLWIWETGVEP